MFSKPLQVGLKRFFSNPVVLNSSYSGFGTKCVHEGTEIDAVSGAVNVPITMSSTFLQPTPGENYPADCMYTRLKNPSRTALEHQLAALENGKYGHVYSSGLGSISNIFSLFEHGDHVLAIDDVYGGTRGLVEDILIPLGLSCDFIDFTDENEFIAAFQENTKMVYLETPTNPTLKITDIEFAANLAHEHGAICCVDNTFATPYLQNPLDLGADIVVHSCTKYLNGHADVVMGLSVTNDEELHERIFDHQTKLGATASPFDCYLCMRGAKTLHLRMDRIQENAEIIASYLDQHDFVEHVIFPGLPNHPQHELAKKQMRGFGGMITFYIKGDLEEARMFLESLEVMGLAVSLGGVESLAESPALMTHQGIEETYREEVLKITNNLIRLSVGVEDIEDLLHDLDQALMKVERMKVFQDNFSFNREHAREMLEG